MRDVSTPERWQLGLWRGTMVGVKPAPQGQIKIVQTDKAAAPIGPYSQAIRAGGFIFVAGEKGIDARTGQIVAGGIGAETRQTLENIKNILEEAGSALSKAVATTVYLVNIGDFAE